MLDLTKEYAFSLTNFYESTCEQFEQLPDLPDARTYEIDITRVLLHFQFELNKSICHLVAQ